MFYTVSPRISSDQGDYVESQGKKVTSLHELADSSVASISVFVSYKTATRRYEDSITLLFKIYHMMICSIQSPHISLINGDYVESEGTGNAIVVNVQQIVSNGHDIHLLLVPLTYDQYIARAATDPTLAAIDVYHGSRPDDAERKSLYA